LSAISEEDGEKLYDTAELSERIDARLIFAQTGRRKRGSLSRSERPELIVRGKRKSCPPQYGPPDPQGVPRRLGESHGFDHGFPLIRSLRASTQRSGSVLFSFVLSLVIVAESFPIRQSKAILPRS
jgi:hypothetical protein